MSARVYLGLFIATCLLCSNVGAQVVAEAVAGHPFGVAHVTLSLDPSVERSDVETNGYRIESDTGHVLYPAFSTRRILGIIRDIIGTRDPGGASSISAWFLFRGSEPFDITVYTPEPHAVRVTPRSRPIRHLRMMDRWWRQYTSAAKSQLRTGDYPPVVETYLTSMLSRRLLLNSDKAVSSKKSSLESELLRLVFNVESLRIDTMRDKILSPQTSEVNATFPLPTELDWPRNNTRVEAAEGSIEQIARYVPSDWLYVRFGSFANYLWLTELTEQHGGDLSRMVTLRGHDALISTKMQLQLGLRETALSKLLGGQVIADMAVVGKDLYMREGAAIGVLFEAKNALLPSELIKQRNAAMKELDDPDAKTEKITIAGESVSFASTPDNRMRSFFASRDGFHLVTNSRSMVEQFLTDGPRLADSSDFIRTRNANPVSKTDGNSNESAFIFLSRDFFRNLLSPHYQIELRRRLNSVTEMELLRLARLASNAEGHGDLPSDQLTRLGFLPGGFGVRPDSSQLEFHDGKLRDSLRGPRGFFLPIPDVPVSQVTANELEFFRKIQTFVKTKWNDMDAAMISVRRSTEEGKHERLEFDARLDSFSPVKYGVWASIIGPPQDKRVLHGEGNIITAQASLQGGQLLPNTGQHLVFFGMRDEPSEISMGRGRLRQTLQVLRTAPAYLGAWPGAGLLDLLPIGGVVVQENNTLQRFPLGLWRYVSDQFSVVSFDQDVLTRSISELAVEQRAETAQLHVHVGDVVHSQLSEWFRALNFQRAYETSVGNTRFLNAISQQLRVPVADSRKIAEEVLDIRLTCSMGGQYQLVSTGDSVYWRSDAWSEDPRDVPSDFATPLAKWFRGLDLTGFVGENDLRLSGSIMMERMKPAGPKIPMLDFFRAKK